MAVTRFVSALSLATATTGMAAASPVEDGIAAADLCRQWGEVAAAEHRVPAQLMHAIALVETQRRVAGRAGPWPWTINVEGQGHWFDTREKAAAFLARSMAERRDPVDVGCFQLNLKWHGAAFTTPDDMLDPARNARYAARFLAALHDEFGDWTRATAAYHSRTPALGTAYVGRVAAVLDEADPRAKPVGEATPTDRGRGRTTAAIPVMPGPLRAGLGAPTGWTRAPSTAATGGAPLGSLMPAPQPAAGAGNAAVFPSPTP